VRFGFTESARRGVQFNYFTDEGAIKFDERTGKFSIDNGKIREAVRLTNELLTLEARVLTTRQRQSSISSLIRPEMKGALDRLSNVPVDINNLPAR
jgi:hypothetical protein